MSAPLEPDETMTSPESFPDGAPFEPFAGPYRLLRPLGEGGMGRVWLAEQPPPLHREVAVKVIKVGMDTAQVIARFEAERQTLALMDHPGIATVFDAGSTAQGRPYFAMEYVKGRPITSYCDDERLSTRERIEVLLQVCGSVEHAHQKGIIHRDLKPSNILIAVVDGRPVPKIIDFGVAKATGPAAIEQTLYTEIGTIVGTPEYMSPEQADLRAADIDTRTDVYALGVVLYELLTGARPFDRYKLRERGLDEMRRVIREQAPTRPSAKVVEADARAERAHARRTDPGKLAGQLRGDLDWITMKALEKDRARRYGSAAELAADLRRYLAHQPVSAGPPTVRYRARKFVSRHRIAVAASAAIGLLALGVAITMVIQAARIAAERDRANYEADVARQVSKYAFELNVKLLPADHTNRKR